MADASDPHLVLEPVGKAVDKTIPLPVPLTFDEAIGILPEGIANAIRGVQLQIEPLAGNLVAKIAAGIIAIGAALIAGAGEVVGTLLATPEVYKEAGAINVRQTITPTLLDPATLALLAFREIVNSEDYRDEMQRHGYTVARSLSFLEAARPLLGEADAVKALIRRILTTESVQADLTHRGYRPGDVDTLIKLARELLAVGDIIALWLRDEITESDAERKLSEHGFNTEDIAHLKSLAFYIPPVPDLVRMAVREAFNPAQIQALDLDQEFPEDFARAAKKQGVSSEWAHHYWQAHWELPSVSQGFEMLHRGIIRPEELANLLKAQDYAPKWRPLLQQISYNVLTRVDTRRMYALGIINEAEVTKSYLDQGYDQTNAERLTRFVVAETLASEVGAVKAKMLTLFRQGIVSEAAIRQLLTALQIPATQQDVIIANEQILAASEALQRRLNLIQAQFMNGVIDQNEALVAIVTIGLPPAAIPEIIAEWVMRRAGKITRLRLQEIEKAFEGGLITEDQFRASLTERNMPESDQDIAVALHRPAVPTGGV